MTTYALRRGPRWITPHGTVTNDVKKAWKTSSIDTAHEMRDLMRMGWGLSSEIRCISQ